MKIKKKIKINRMEEISDHVRDCDPIINDNLLSSSVSSTISQEFSPYDENDLELYQALEESIKIYELEQNFQKKQLEAEKRRKEKELELTMKENLRIEKLREKLGIIISRLKTAFNNDPYANDLLECIEWECTPYNQLSSLKPVTKNSLIEIKKWANHNLNPKMNEILESLSFF